MLKLTKAASDVSRTNQVKIISPVEEVAEKLFQYLFKMNLGIETFKADDLDLSRYDSSSLSFFQKRDRAIRHEVQRRLAEHGIDTKYPDIKYSLSYFNRTNYVFFLSPNKTHSGWKDLFCHKWGVRNRERILNLVFKLHFLAGEFEVIDTSANGLEDPQKLLFVHSSHSTKSKKALVIWGQSLFLNYNRHHVLTLTLSRKRLLFVPEDTYEFLDGDDLGELLIYKEKKYYCSEKLDARRKNSLLFMRFDKDNDDYDKFRKTQLYYYQNLMTQLESFLRTCDIAFTPLYFQADHYLEDPFIKNIRPVTSLEIINNTGIDLTETDRQFLRTFLKHQGVSQLTFYNSGKTISTYESVDVENEEDACWKIIEIVPWLGIELDQEKNYLVFNRQLEEEAGSMAYQLDDGFWYPSTKITSKPQVDFYSQLKRRFNYLDTGKFFSMQGINVAAFRAVGDDKADWSILNYTRRKVDEDRLHLDTRPFTDGQYLDVNDAIFCYLREQQDGTQWSMFCDRHKIKVAPEFQKVLIELGIKNWIRESFSEQSIGLSIDSQTFPEKHFFAIYVRNPRYQKVKAIAVEFIYKEGAIYITGVMRDVRQIKQRFPFLRTLKNQPDVLKNNQQYFADEAEKVCISCYTDDFFTPTLIGRNGIFEEMEAGELKINRAIKGKNSSRLLPLVSYYNAEIRPIKRIHSMICFDLSNETFIQYYVPPGQGIAQKIKNGFRVYHLIGSTYDGKTIPTSELIEHPITALHFSTLTQNVLRISNNSQSSLLQKIAKVLVEN
jgi:hypothetical protein